MTSAHGRTLRTYNPEWTQQIALRKQNRRLKTYNRILAATSVLVLFILIPVLVSLGH